MSSHFVIQRDISVQFFQYDPETETILAKVAVNKRVNIFNIVSWHMEGVILLLVRKQAHNLGGLEQKKYKVELFYYAWFYNIHSVRQSPLNQERLMILLQKASFFFIYFFYSPSEFPSWRVILIGSSYLLDKLRDSGGCSEVYGFDQQNKGKLVYINFHNFNEIKIDRKKRQLTEEPKIT